MHVHPILHKVERSIIYGKEAKENRGKSGLQHMHIKY